MRKKATGWESASQGTHAYIGVKPACGCAEVMCVDVPDGRKAVAKLVSRMIQEGYHVHRITVEEARKVAYRQCPHDRQGEFDFDPDTLQLEGAPA